MLGLIAATGLRISEALDLRLHDVLPDSVLQIRRTKFGKSRLVPLHPTTANALECYLEERRPLAVTDDHVFLSAGDQRIAASTVQYTFRRMCRLAGIAPADRRERFGRNPHTGSISRCDRLRVALRIDVD